MHNVVSHPEKQNIDTKSCSSQRASHLSFLKSKFEHQPFETFNDKMEAVLAKDHKWMTHVYAAC